MVMCPYAFAQRDDVLTLRDAYTRNRRIQIRGFLTQDAADSAYAAISTQTPWRTIYNDGNHAIDVSASELDGLSLERRTALTRSIFAGAAKGFQYCFDQYSLSEHLRDGPDMPTALRELGLFFTSMEFIKFMRSVTGDEDIAFSDAMLSRYRPSHFLTTHDDRLAALSRRHAYVLGLTPGWQVDWGGLLVFRDENGNISSGYTPSFNVLSIFSVPQEHAVTFVAPFAPYPRISVTGWLHGP